MKLIKTKKDATLPASNFDLFISYSRRDEAFVRRLYDALGEHDRRAWVDWKGIPPTADWLAEVFAAIESAENFVFVISKASLASEVCAREVDHAVKCRKRLVPLVWGQIEDEKVPAELRRLNWIVCRNDEEFPRASSSLLEALSLNLEWVREHTRLLVRAVDWRDGGADASLLLRGADLREAEHWLARGADEEPKPTELHRDYVIASRAQERSRARRTLSVVVAGLILAIGLAIVALVQRNVAQQQRAVAEQRRQEAETRRVEAERQGVAALTNESNASLSLGRELDALLAAVKAGRKLQQEPALLDGSKPVYRTLLALRRAVFEGHERNRIATGHFRGVTHLAFAPDDQSIYSVGGGGDIKHWSLDGQLLSSFETEHSGLADGCTFIQNFAVSPDGKLLATVGNEGGFALWSETGVPRGAFDAGIEGGRENTCTGIVDSAIDFAARTVTIRDEQQKRVWSFSGKLVGTPETVAGAVESENRNVSSADGSMTAVANDDQSVSVRRGQAEVLRLPHQRTPVFSHHPGRLVTISDDVDNSIFHLWDLNSPEPAFPEAAARREPAPSKKKMKLGDRSVDLDATAAFGTFAGVTSPDGQLAAVVTGENGQSLQLWRISGEPSRIAEFDAEQIASADFSEALQSLAFSPDSKLLVSGGTDGTVKFWSTEGKLVRKLVAHSSYTNARLSPDGRLLLTWGDGRDGEVQVKLWTADGELLDSLSRERVTDAWFSSDSRWIFALEEGKTKVWSLDLDTLVRQGCDALRLYLANPAMAQERGVCS